MKEQERSVHGDVEALEFYVRDSMHEMGRKVLECLLNADGGGYRGSSIACACGHRSRFVGYRSKTVLTVLGPVRVTRSYYYDKKCRKGSCPKDAELHIVGVGFSIGIRRMMARVGALRPFKQGREDIRELAGLEVNAKDIERISRQIGQEVEKFLEHEQTSIGTVGPNGVATHRAPVLYVCMDGTGVPMVPGELVGHKGKGEDGRARTREAKLACVFTQTKVDEEGYPVRDEASTSYVGAIESASAFAQRVMPETERRGIGQARQVCAIGDAAEWIWNIAGDHLPEAQQIVDLYHAREHYWAVGRAVFATQAERLHGWAHARREELDRGDVEQVITAIKRLRPRGGEIQKLCQTTISYYVKNAHRMRYGDFRAKGFFVGSGVLEAGCRSVIGQRLKLSGMHWTVKGADSIIALRCCLMSDRWEDFWAYRATA